jgi:hypothetical protein
MNNASEERVHTAQYRASSPVVGQMSACMSTLALTLSVLIALLSHLRKNMDCMGWVWRRCVLVEHDFFGGFVVAD